MTRPDGEPGIYGVVEFKNSAVGVLPVDEDGRVWLVGQYRYPLHAYSWEIPEGGGPAFEPPETTAGASCARRPDWPPPTLELVATVHLSNSVSDEIGLYLPGDGARPGASMPEGTEKIRAAD